MAVKKTVKKSARKGFKVSKSIKPKIKKTVTKVAGKAKNTAKNTAKKVAKKITKKAVRKVVSKVEKIVSPKGVEVKVTRQIGKSVPTEYHFYLQDGRRLKNVLELVEAFDDMAEDVFEHHVTDENNDFANWLHHVFNEKELAKEIKAAEDRMDMHMKLLKHAVKKLTE